MRPSRQVILTVHWILGNMARGWRGGPGCSPRKIANPENICLSRIQAWSRWGHGFLYSWPLEGFTPGCWQTLTKFGVCFTDLVLWHCRKDQRLTRCQGSWVWERSATCLREAWTFRIRRTWTLRSLILRSLPWRAGKLPVPSSMAGGYPARWQLCHGLTGASAEDSLRSKSLQCQKPKGRKPMRTDIKMRC